MQITIVRTADQISPHLQHMLRAVSNRQPILEAVGMQLVSMGKRAFSDPSLRPATWLPRKSGGSHALLRKSGTLWRSLRVVAVTNSAVTIGSDRAYAAIHQLGGRTKAHIIRPKKGKALAWPGAAHPVKKVNHPGSRIPARPFFPILGSGMMTATAREKVEGIITKKLTA